MLKRNGTILKTYIFILLYSSALRIFLGRWGTIVSDIATILCFLYCIYDSGHFVIRHDKTIRNIFVLIILIQIIAVLEIFNANINNQLYALIEYRKSYFQILCFLPAYWLFKRSDQSIDSIIKYIGLISLPLILYGIKQKYFWSAIDSKFVDMTDADTYTNMYHGFVRSVSFFSGPFHYGLFCALIFSMYLYLWRKNKRISYFIQLVLAFWGCYSSITRTNLLCCISVLLIFFLAYLAYERKKNSLLIKIMSIVIFCIILMLMFTSFDVQFNLQTPIGQMMNSFTNLSEDQRFATRILTWKQGISYIFKKPIIGYGIGASADTMSIHAISKIHITSHNMFLKLFLETGLIGGLLYIFLFVTVLVKIKKAYSDEHLISCMFYSLFSSIFFNALVGSTIASFPNLSLFWVISAVLLANYSRNKKRKLRENNEPEC